MARWMNKRGRALWAAGIGFLLVTGVSLAAEGDGANPEQATMALGGVNLPYTGQGSVWVIDDGYLVIRFERAQQPPASADALRSKGDTGGGGFGGNARSHPDPSTVGRTGTGGGVGVGGGESTSDVRILPLRLTTQGLVLAGDGHTWHLQSKPPSEAERRTPKPQVISVAPRGEQPCRRHSLLDLTGSLHLRVGPTGAVQLDARDDKTGRRLLATLQPEPAPTSEVPCPEAGEDNSVVRISWEITCNNQTSCSVSISCDPAQGCWVLCFCDANGNATCLSGHGKMPEVSVPDP
ncbi:MAG: hypothetical protein AB1601_09730 [Planctomycetota bacterium]